MRYRRVSGEFWLDSRVRALPLEDCRWAFLYVLTCPSMTSVGAMRATVAGLAAELGWKLKRFRNALDPLVACGMVELNEPAQYLGLPKFLKHNAPESHNVVRGWVKALGLVPDCPERRALIARCRDYLAARESAGDLKQGFRQAYEEALAEAFADAYALQSVIPEQEQEQETGAGGISPTPLSTVVENGIGRRGARQVKL